MNVDRIAPNTHAANNPRSTLGIASEMIRGNALSPFSYQLISGCAKLAMIPGHTRKNGVIIVSKPAYIIPF